MEEAQHAKLDTLIVEALAEGRRGGIEAAIDGYLEIGRFLDGGLKAQAELNLDAFERRRAAYSLRGTARCFLAVQHQAARWTYLGSGMVHPRFAQDARRDLPRRTRPHRRRRAGLFLITPRRRDEPR
jgi:hypothetical protein